MAARKAKAKAKSAAPKKAPAAAPAKKLTAVKERYTKSSIIGEISNNTELSRKQVTAVIDELTDLIERHIKKRSVGEFTLPGLLKIRSVKRPATKAKMGRNPATGEEIMIKAKPASIRVRVTPLKKLKDMVG